MSLLPWMNTLLSYSLFAGISFGPALLAADGDGLVIVNKEGRDVQTLFAGIGPRISFVSRGIPSLRDLQIQPNDCLLQEDSSFDCTAAVRTELSKRPGFETLVLLRPLILPAEVTAEGAIFPTDTRCSLIELHSIIRRSIWNNPRFEGLGFFAGSLPVFIEKSKLLAQKDAFFLSNNEPALIHSFWDFGLCQKAVEANADTYAFKAFAQFTGIETDQLVRVWEASPVNYQLSLQPGHQGFDRTLDIVRP